MKILNSIAYLILPIAIISNNNSYTSDSDSTDSSNTFQGNSDGENNNNNTHNNNHNTGDFFKGTEAEFQEFIKTLGTEKQNNNHNNQVNARDQIVKFENGRALCSLVSLQQCLSALNPSSNKLLNDFMKKYNELYNNKTLNGKLCHPHDIFNELLCNIDDNNSAKNKLMVDKPRDISMERLDALREISKHPYINSNIDDVIYHIMPISLDNEALEEAKLNECKKLNIIIEPMICDDYSNNTIENEEIDVNGNTYDLVSVALYQPGHYASAKKKTNGKWIFIDSNYPEKIKQFDSLKDLLKNVRQYNFTPKLLFFTKQQ